MKKINQSGFSLIELILVILIIGIIAAIAVPSLLKAKDMAEMGGAYTTMRTFSTLQVKYYSQKNRFGKITELNDGQEINIGTNNGNSMNRGKFVYTMNPSLPTDAELRSQYTIIATRPGIGTEPPTILEVNESGRIIGIF